LNLFEISFAFLQSLGVQFHQSHFIPSTEFRLWNAQRAANLLPCSKPTLVYKALQGLPNEPSLTQALNWLASGAVVSALAILRPIGSVFEAPLFYPPLSFCPNFAKSFHTAAYHTTVPGSVVFQCVRVHRRQRRLSGQSSRIKTSFT